MRRYAFNLKEVNQATSHSSSLHFLGVHVIPHFSAYIMRCPCHVTAAKRNLHGSLGTMKNYEND